MADRNTLSPRKARVAWLASLVFFLAGAVLAAGCVTGIADPGIHVMCDGKGCVRRSEPWRIAPESERAAIETSAAARTTFVRHLDRPLVRAGYAGVVALSYAPFVLLMIAVAMALRRLATPASDPLARALPWLRRAASAAVLMVVLRPVADSLDVMLLYPGTPAGAHWEIPLDFNAMAQGLLLALGAYSVVWAIDAGSRAQRDLAEFI